MSQKKIMLTQQDSIIFIDPNELVFCRSDNCYTNLQMLNGEKIMIVKSLTKFHKELSSKFMRVNQSYVINKLFIEKIEKKKKSILLYGNFSIPFTTTLKELIKLIETTQENDSL